MSNTISSSNDTMASMEIAMTKRAETQQGQQILSLISGATATAQSATNAAVNSSSDALATEGSLGTHINLHV